jgi:hypothetical protein
MQAILSLPDSRKASKPARVASSLRLEVCYGPRYGRDHRARNGFLTVLFHTRPTLRANCLGDAAICFSSGTPQY